MVEVADPLDYREIWMRLQSGRIVPFFGAGASACYGLPSGEALARSLIKASEFPGTRGLEDLAFIASYLVEKKDSIVLNRTVREAITIEHAPGELHRLLAGCTAIKLYVTTNYD